MNIIKKNLLTACAVLFVATGCKFNSDTQKIEQGAIATGNKKVFLTPLDGYFSAIKTSEEKAFIVEKSEFDSLFHAAPTMAHIPRKVDFSKERVGAIILPETEYATDIVLDSTYILDKILHIYYSIKSDDEKRSFSILPVKLFTFDLALNIDSVVFNKKAKL